MFSDDYLLINSNYFNCSHNANIVQRHLRHNPSVPCVYVHLEMNMDALKNTIDELATNFNQRFDDFQKEVRSSIPAASPSSNIIGQFQAFRTFVMTSLESLQLQLQLLARQQDDMETRTRRKILLVHGVPEDRDENATQCVAKLLSERLAMSDITVGAIARCHRLGRPVSDKPRVILIKFRDQALRDKTWFGKTKLKGSGVTLSEFMTKGRHEAFVAARKKFGVSQCWTRDGYVVVLGPDGTRHRVITVAEVNAIPDPVNAPGPAAQGTASAAQAKPSVRVRKPIRK